MILPEFLIEGEAARVMPGCDLIWRERIPAELDRLRPRGSKLSLGTCKLILHDCNGTRQVLHGGAPIRA
ncbi:hypothetical protein [Paracoccus saliphilus]|uniref:Uncharacterized protein n=1 Tax=Paracoccus saliphilus TaxID=405559 RepID=A0ABY7SFV6_9RHOB|nr:hypothetical protein [Paracoccus saliphilus]WCR04746.1 hypothetical protein JHX88_08525 [Paracoccus saliphilus]